MSTEGAFAAEAPGSRRATSEGFAAQEEAGDGPAREGVSTSGRFRTEGAGTSRHLPSGGEKMSRQDDKAKGSGRSGSLSPPPVPGLRAKFEFVYGVHLHNVDNTLHFFALSHELQMIPVLFHF